MESLKVMIEKAKKANACDEAIRELEKLNSIEEVMKHEKAPEWISWYAENVIKGRWNEAEDIIRTNPFYNKLYQKYISATVH